MLLCTVVLTIVDPVLGKREALPQTTVLVRLSEEPGRVHKVLAAEVLCNLLRGCQLSIGPIRMARRVREEKEKSKQGDDHRGSPSLDVRDRLQLPCWGQSSNVRSSCLSTHLVPERNVAGAIVLDRAELGVFVQVVHELLHALDAPDEVDNALLVVLLVERDVDVVDGLCENGREADAHSRLESQCCCRQSQHT